MQDVFLNHSNMTKKHLVWSFSILFRRLERSKVNHYIYMWVQPRESISIFHLAANVNVSLRLLARGKWQFWYMRLQ